MELRGADIEFITLVSASPRRRELLALLGWQFKLCTVHTDERVRPGERAEDYVVRLAATKAELGENQGLGQGIILTADTAVVDRNQIRGKPASAQEATSMLRNLRGKSHRVITAIAVTKIGTTKEMVTATCTTTVEMREYSDQEIENYVIRGDPFDKAGAYAIQHKAFHPVHKIHGCYANIMGLPLCHLSQLMRKFGVKTTANIHVGCLEKLGFQCDVYPAILEETR